MVGAQKHRGRGAFLIPIVGAVALLFGACSDDASGDGTSSGNGGGGGGASGGSGGSGGDGGDPIVVTGGSGGGISGCNPQTFELQQAPTPEVYLVIDRSGSMNEPGATAGLTRWQEVNAAVDTLLTQYEASIRIGLLMYPTGTECNTSGPQVAFKEYNRGVIMEQLGSAVPAGGTPTAAALNNAASSLTALGSPDSPKFVVLATDGGPNCNYFLDAQPSCACSYASAADCCTNTPGQCLYGNLCLDDQHTLDVIDDLRGQSIDTFVIGLAGTSAYEDLLNAMATAGGHPQQGGTTDYYAANNQQELLDALQTIAVSLISCQIELATAPDNPDGVSVYIDGDEVGRDPSKTNGWDYTDGTNTTIELYGPACETLQDGSEHDLTATFACEIF
jgi:hypothetical protein